MFKFASILFSALLIVVGTNSALASEQILIDVSSLQQSVMTEASTAGLNWHVGDRAQYSVKGGFISGKMDSFVREDVAEGIWVEQNVDMGFLGKQKIEILFDKRDGRILKLIANGQEQEIPTADDAEIVEMKEARVQVPAGSFDCIYVKIKDKDNKESEAWLNPQAVPMSGLIKATAESPLGKITTELLSFSFAQ